MNTKKRDLFNSPSWHTIYLSFIFCLTLAILYFLMPQERRFRYEFRKGRPWMHETLIAPYTFAILKSDKVIKVERDSVLNNLIPYLSLQDSVAKGQITALSNKIDEIFRKEKTEIIYSRVIKTKVLEVFEKLYGNGILEQSPGSYPFLNNRKKEAYLVKGNVAQKIAIPRIYSLKTAYTKAVFDLDELKDTDKDLKLTIEKLNPEEFISSNLVYDGVKTGAERNKVLDNVSTTRGVVQEGERIVAKGDVISPQTYTILESLKNSVESNHGRSEKILPDCVRQTDIYYRTAAHLIPVYFSYQAIPVAFKARHHLHPCDDDPDDFLLQDRHFLRYISGLYCALYRSCPDHPHVS